MCTTTESLSRRMRRAVATSPSTVYFTADGFQSNSSVRFVNLFVSPNYLCFSSGFQAETSQVRESALYVREQHDFEALKVSTRALLSGTTTASMSTSSSSSVAPAEPVYCYCNGPSHGQMIECDNPACPIGWFHFGCVHLQRKPAGQWMCPDCRKPSESKAKSSTSSSARKRKR